jgi:hypothetical protein
MTGRVIAGRYNLQHPIGRGAMGVVWRARDQILDRDVAVKEVVISSLLGEDERRNAYQRTLREARTAARLSHRGLVAVYDVAEDDGRPWIVMELVPSRSLDQVLTVEGRLPPLRVARIGQQLLSALAAAHIAGVLHRDVKPSNVLIATDRTGTGWDERAVLTDFGIAQFEGDPRLTQTGMVMGSPGFTAPERIRGGDATPASDLWSLGATLFAAVEGRGPYEQRGGAITTMSAIINEDAPVAAHAGRLAPVIGALLRRDPSSRPTASAAARMFAYVLPLLSAEPESSGPAHPPTAASQARPWAAPPAGPAKPEPARKLAAAAAPAAIAAPAPAIAATTPENRASAMARPPASPPAEARTPAPAPAPAPVKAPAKVPAKAPAKAETPSTPEAAPEPVAADAADPDTEPKPATEPSPGTQPRTAKSPKASAPAAGAQAAGRKAEAADGGETDGHETSANADAEEAAAAAEAKEGAEATPTEADAKADGGAPADGDVDSAAEAAAKPVDGAVPVEAVSDEAVSDETVRDEAVPDKAVPDEAAPEDVGSDEAGSEDAASPEDAVSPDENVSAVDAVSAVEAPQPPDDIEDAGSPVPAEVTPVAAERTEASAARRGPDDAAKPGLGDSEADQQPAGSRQQQKPKPAPTFTAARPGDRPPVPTFSAVRSDQPGTAQRTPQAARAAAQPSSPPTYWPAPQGPSSPGGGWSSPPRAEGGASGYGSYSGAASPLPGAGSQYPGPTKQYADLAAQYPPAPAVGAGQRRGGSRRWILVVICAVLVAAAIGAGTALALRHNNGGSSGAGTTAVVQGHSPATPFGSVYALNKPSTVVTTS